MSRDTRSGPVASVLLAGALATACGGSGGNSNSETGVFLDGPVAGLRYEGTRYSGTTDAQGRYQYDPGDEVCFFLGFIEFGCAQARGILSPIDLFPDADAEDARVLNVVRFLMSLDVDGDPSNGIDVRGIQTVAGDAAIDFDQSSTAFGEDPLVLGFVAEEGFDGELVDEETADMHLEESLADSYYYEQRLFGNWTYTLYSGEAVDVSDAVQIDEQEIDDVDGDVTGAGEVFFVLDGEGGALCFHEGAFDGDDFVGGDVDCTDSELLDEFRLDRIDADEDYGLSDLMGVWYVRWGAESGELDFDEQSAALWNASVSAGGTVRFEIEGCSWRGEMNADRDFVSGNVVCEGQDAGAFAMEVPL